VAVEAVVVTGSWWRHTPHGGDPLFLGDPPSDGRWQRGAVVSALYFADSEETAWAEWYRALAELAIPPARQMPRDLWRWDVDASDVADLSDDQELAAVGLGRPEPGQRTWPAFQAIGEGLWREGHRGVLAPSFTPSAAATAAPMAATASGCSVRDAQVTGSSSAPLPLDSAPAPPASVPSQTISACRRAIGIVFTFARGIWNPR
jgi:RES domain-containing protein